MEQEDWFCGACGKRREIPTKQSEPIIDGNAEIASDEFKHMEEELAAKAKARPSDVEVAATEVR
jgi:uncharacterized Fe-S cluster-containing protein